MNNSQFVNWVIGKIWNRPDMLHGYFANEWLEKLNCGFQTSGNQRAPFNRKILVEHFMGMVQQENKNEEKRLAMLNSTIPDRVNVTVM